MDRQQLLESTRLNLIKRANEQAVLRKDADKRSAFYEFCRRSIFFYFEHCVFTVRDSNFYPEEFGNDIPFLLFDFQKEFVKGLWEAICEGAKPSSERTFATDVFIEKSRQMGISWLVSAVFVYGFIFHNHRYLCISQKEEFVDDVGNMRSLFEKMRYMISLLPKFTLPKGLTREIGTSTNKYMSLSRSDGPGSITGESANKNASRGGTYNAILLDEMASMENAKTINFAAARATPCRIFNSTPAGKGNEFYRIRQRGEEAIKHGKEPPFQWFKLHWSEHPFYDRAWYERQCAKDTKEVIAQELDISYNTSVTGRVYPEFTGETVGIIEYDEGLPLFISIDNSHGGADPHAIIVCQIDGHNWNIIDYLEINCSVSDIAMMFGKQPKMAMSDTVSEFYNRYKRWKPATFIADPYDTYATLNTSTISQEYSKNGIYLNTPNEKKKDQQILQTRSNMYRVRISDRAGDLANALANSRYPERSDTSQSTSERNLPVHDQWSHGRSSMEYLSCFLLETNISTKPKHNFTTEEISLEGPMSRDWFGVDDVSSNVGYYESIF